MTTLLGILLSIVAVFMVLLVLVQKGRGGGLAGALGGMGGQSAFGTKAGDLFTRITMWAAFAWIVLCAVTVWYLGKEHSAIEEAGKNLPSATQGTGKSGVGETGAGGSGKSGAGTTAGDSNTTRPADGGGTK
jgi:preprotein translocase subunit SecG